MLHFSTIFSRVDANTFSAWTVLIAYFSKLMIFRSRTQILHLWWQKGLEFHGIFKVTKFEDKSCYDGILRAKLTILVIFYNLANKKVKFINSTHFDADNFI